MTASARGQRGKRGVTSTVVERELARRTAPLPGELTRPWSPKDLTRLLAILSFSAIALGISWLGVSGTVLWRDQIIWTATAIGVVAVTGLTIMSWLLTGFRNVRIRQSQLVDSVAGRLVLPDPALPADQAVADATIVTAPGMTHFHTPGCLLVRGKPTHSVSGAARAALEPCRACSPQAAA